MRSSNMHHLYPVMLDLTDRRVLVVGGGLVGARKAEGMLIAGALVTAISPQWHKAWDHLAQVERHTRTYEPGDVDGFWLAIAATNDAAIQQQIFDDGEALRTWVNAADDPDRCAWILPAVHRDGPVVVSVSTSGSSPALAGWLRDRLRAALPHNVELVAQELQNERRRMHEAGESTEQIDWTTRITELFGEQ